MSETNLVDVLEEYAMAAPEGNDHQVLTSMIEKYPQFDTDLTDFAAARAVIKFAPEAEISASEEMRYQESGVKSLREVLGAYNSATPAQNVLSSLTEAAKEKGLNKKTFAGALGLSVSLVMYLEKRRLEFESIPKSIVAKLAQVLETAEEAISSYLSQPPDLATGASFKTSTRPEELKPKSFSEAVREDQTLTPEDKRKLLDSI